MVASSGKSGSPVCLTSLSLFLNDERVEEKSGTRMDPRFHSRSCPNPPHPPPLINVFTATRPAPSFDATTLYRQLFMNFENPPSAPNQTPVTSNETRRSFIKK